MSDAGPTIAVHITTEHVCMAVDLYALIGEAMALVEESRPVTLKVDWNGCNPTPWDMSFVPTMVVRDESYE
jgi:hypothetical protein